MNIEVWKPIVGTNFKHFVSSEGEVSNWGGKGKRHYLKQKIDRAGYLTVSLKVDGSRKTKFVHRLVAKAFRHKPKNKEYVNHIDGVKTNNLMENLEWVTHSENMQHAYKTGLCKKTGCKVVDICSGKTYATIKEAADDLGLKYPTCRNYLSGNIKKNKTCLQYAA